MGPDVLPENTNILLYDMMYSKMPLFILIITSLLLSFIVKHKIAEKPFLTLWICNVLNILLSLILGSLFLIHGSSDMSYLSPIL